MFSQGNYNSQSGQGPQKPRPPSYSQALPPRLPHNFQQGPLLPSPQVPPRPGQPGLPMFQHGPLAPHFQQVPPAGMPNPGQLYLHRPPTVPGSAPLPHLYSTAQQNSQHSYLAPGPPPRSLPPTTSQGQILYRPPIHQPPLQTGGVQGLQQIPLPPPPLPTTSFPTLSVSGSESTTGNSQMSSLTLPPRPLPPPFLSSPIPPPLRPPSSGTLSGSSSGSSPPPKPAEEIVEKIEELCQLIAKNGSAFEDMARQRETENPIFKFLFGGEPGSEAAIAHDYFLWMKKKCKIEGNEHAVPTYLLTVATESHSPADSDMEMEDDITGSDIDPALNQPFKGPTQATVLKSCEDAEKQLHTLPTLVGSDAAPMISTDTELCSGSTGLGEQGPKFIPSCDDKSPVINLTQATEYPFVGDRENFSAPLIDDKSSSGLSGAVECISSDKCPGQVMNGSSPFRLLQAYASNDSSENDDDSCLKDANPKTVSPLVAVSTEGLKLSQDSRLSSKLDAGSRGPYKAERGFGQPSNSGISCRSVELSSDSQKEVKETVPTLVASRLATKHIDAVQNQLSIDHAANSEGPPSADTSGGEWGANATLCSKYEKDIEDKTAKFTSNTHKIDKYGRLVREGASDTDSDDSHGARTHSKRGRSRSRSRSKSPKNRRRRRRRSPRRRRENKSRSRSWSPRDRRSRSRSPRNRRSRSRSPRNRRSRSRSPSFRHASEYRSGSMRWEKGQLQACFDFLRGKCYRGASCRYLHHDSEKSDISRYHRSKQPFVQLPPTSKNGNTHEDSKKSSLKISDHEQEIMNQEVQHKHGMPTISVLATKDDTVGTTLLNSDGAYSGRVREAAGKGPETKVLERSENATCIDKNGPEAVESDRPMVIDGHPSKLASNTEVLESYGQASKDMFSSVKDSVVQQSGPIRSHVVLEDTHHPDQQTDDSSVSDSLPDKTSATSPEKLLPTSADSINHPPRPPFTASAPNLEDSNTPLVAQLPRDHNLMPRTVASQSQSACLENFPSYMLPNQGSLLSVPLKSSSVPLPPPPPPLLPPLLPAHVLTVNAGAAQSGVSSQFHQVCLPPKSDLGSQMFSRPPYSTELSGNSQVGEFQHQAYPPVQEPHWPLLHAKDFRLNPLPGSNPSSQQFGSTGKFGEDRLKQLQMQGLNTSDSFTLNNIYPQPVSFPQESFEMKMQSFPDESLPPGKILKSSSQNPYLQQQQPPHDLHHSVSNNVYGLPGNNSSSRYQLDHQDRDQSTHLPEFGVTRSSSHFNPYASTFEKPLSSRFSSEVFRQEKDSTYGDKHDHPFSLSHASVDVQGVGSGQATTSPTSAKVVGKIIPVSAGEQYDPLFDSIEPSSNSLKKSNNIQKWEPSGNSNIMLRLKDSNQALDVEENNRKKEVGSVTLATSLDNEEFGETADAEVGDVENESQSNPDALVNTNMGEMEIDQIKSPGKSRNGKESRSMKLFKACLADFVKEVLKPSWRQGNMSKETFKTVVKKTVDKVAGATKGHQIPKSKAKINQYIDSSQRKLTKLVMGYVDKYAKG